MAQRGNLILVLGLATAGTFASVGWQISDEAFKEVSGRKFAWTTGEDESWIDDRSQFLRPTQQRIERHMTPQLLAYIKAKYKLPVVGSVDKSLPHFPADATTGPIIGDQAMYANMYNKVVHAQVHTDTGRQLVELTYVEHGVHRQQVQLTFTGSIDQLTHEELTELGEDIRTSIGLIILAKAKADKDGTA